MSGTAASKSVSASLTRTPAWRALVAHHRSWNERHLRDLFAADPQRFERFSLEAGGLLLDYSKNLITAETRDLLVQLALERGLPDRVAALLAGKRVNQTEKRAAWHTALRAGDAAPREVRRTLAAMRIFADALRAGQLQGVTGQPIRNVVSLGIGGSALGPALVARACAPDTASPRVHFVSTPGEAMTRLLSTLDPSTTLFIVQSKSFSTMETARNAQAAKAWLLAGLPTTDIGAHFAAVTANVEAAGAFGIAPERLFPMWDWVGGRYSVWSAVGLPAMIAMGSTAFDELLAGAALMDRHFAEAPPERNMPMLMGLIGLWHHNFCGGASRAVISYEHGLALLPPYLQQLEMESLGKSVTQKGKALRTGSGTVVWGGLGINAQHAYMQSLHQGTQLVPVDFIAACLPRYDGDTDTQAIILANCFAQSALLMQGVSADDIKQQLTAGGMDAKEAARLAPHQALPGNRPSNTLLLPSLTPHSLGALLALYEHRTFVKAAILDINAFDQYGVEHGKKLAGSLLPELNGKPPATTHDTSTSALIRHALKNNGRKP
jgi:glucose-6-phosphate isomerase